MRYHFPAICWVLLVQLLSRRVLAQNALHINKQSDQVRLKEATQDDDVAADTNNACNSAVGVRKVAVIGAGMGGSAASYFLKRLPATQEATQSCTRSSPQLVHTTVFEATDTIGGRAAIKDFNGYHVEIGGSVFHQSNRFMMAWCDEFGLERQKGFSSDDGSDSTVGVWDGDTGSFLFRTSEWKVVTMARVLWRYGLSPLRMQNLAEATGDLFGKLYSGLPWTTLSGALEKTGLASYITTMAQEWLPGQGISKTYADEILTGIVRNTYGQNLSMHTLGLLVSAIGSDSNLYSVKGGNRQVAEHILRSSKTEVRLNTPVTTVRHCGVDSDSLCITTAAGEESMYDAVIIATPLENAHMDIPHDYSRSDEPADATSEDVHERPFRTTHTTLVAGTINPVYFGEDPGQSLPDDIFTTESVAHQDFSSISKLGRVKSTATTSDSDATAVYKLFSRTAIPYDTLNQIFLSTSDVFRHTWSHAYPVLHPTPRLPPVQPATGVFYINAFETIISCMECSAVSAHNTVQLALEYLGVPFVANATVIDSEQ